MTESPSRRLPLLATKLFVPRARQSMVSRRHLAERLNGCLHHQLTLVSAPAGFGKTTLVSTWAQAARIPVAWLSLDEADNDPTRFLSYLVAALQQIDAMIGRDVQGTLEASPLPRIDAVIGALVNDLVARPADFVLVLDDFHTIDEATIHEAIRNLVAHQPPQMHLVIVTREDPPLPLARLRARDQLVELRTQDLRFTVEEASIFLKEVMGLALEARDVHELNARTEGWIAGLQLAGLSVRDRANPSRYIAGLSGTHRYILSYLTEEVLSQQTEDVQSFLLQTSILDKLSGKLCDAVTGRTDSAALLERLFAANLFLIPLDDEQQWYRYHHLFADLLASRLRQTVPADTIQERHCRAGEWLAQNDYLDEAIGHTLAGKDYERAAALVEQVGRTMMFAGRANTLRNWLEALPEVSFQTQPRLSIFRMWIDLMQGKSDLSERALQEKETMLRALPPSPENDQLQRELMVVLCRFVALSGNTARAIRLAREALGYLSEGDLASRARVNSALAMAYGLEGNTEEAEPAYQRCLHQAIATGYYSLAAHTLMMMAMLKPHYGQLHEAARSYQSIVDMGVQSGQKVFFPAGQGYVGLASIHLEWNDLATAEEYLKQGMELCSRGGLDGILYGYVLKSRLRQAKGDLEGAMEEIHLLERAFPMRHPSVAGRQILIRLAMGDLDEAARLATPWLDMFGGGRITARLPLLVSEEGKGTVVRVFLARGEIERAMRLLDEVEATAEPGRRFGRMIEVYLLRALALQKQNRGNIPPAALECFERSLELAEPEGYVLLFLEEGPDVLPLLNAVANHVAAPERLKQYARRLLNAFPGDGEHAAAPVGDAAGLEEMIEPLSKRELEILRLIGEGCSNQEIAGRLVITLHTVKKHSSNVFAKLGVKSRTQAVARARQLRLL